LLASSALVGQLNGMKANGINIINAVVIGREKGLSISARHEPTKKPTLSTSVSEDLEKSLQLTVRRGTSQIQLIGTTLFLLSIYELIKKKVSCS